MNIKLFLKEPRRLIQVIAKTGAFNTMPDETYLKLISYAFFGQKMNISNPTTFNEKLQWLKLHDRKPEYTTMVDKIAAKQWAANRIGDQYIIPTLGVWNRFDDIDFDLLPNQFVLKCTHDSGGLVICKDKGTLDIKKTKQKIETSLKRNYYLTGREWPYKDVPRRIIAEKYMTDSDTADSFTDYKFFCFNGDVDCVMLCIDRATGDTKFYFFDKNWNFKRYNIRGKNAPKNFTLPKPEKMDEMFEVAAKLSEGMPFVRVDLYVSKGCVYFGEMTFYPDSGFDANLLEETDNYFGKLIKIK